MNTINIDERTLQCPSCKGEYLHQVEVVAYWGGEDKGTGLKMVSSPERCFIGTSMEGNPSPRRQGLTIRFDCESCSAELLLSVVQHKGQTLIQWE